MAELQIICTLHSQPHIYMNGDAIMSFRYDIGFANIPPFTTPCDLLRTTTGAGNINNVSCNHIHIFQCTVSLLLSTVRWMKVHIHIFLPPVERDCKVGDRETVMSLLPVWSHEPDQAKPRM